MPGLRKVWRQMAMKSAGRERASRMVLRNGLGDRFTRHVLTSGDERPPHERPRPSNESVAGSGADAALILTVTLSDTSGPLELLLKMDT